MKYLFVKHRFIKHIFLTPLILGAVIPMALLDLWIELFHRISFPVYNIPYVRRSKYIKVDRYKLSYLNPAQKINCVYCGYANGLVQYWGEIIAETENYWCGIKHTEKEGFIPPAHHKDYITYGDRKEYNEVYESKKTSPF